MQVHSIISNTISEEILHSGHLSIRFMTDGFSLLLEDQSNKPVVLNHFTNTTSHSLSGNIQACREWLIKHTLLESFRGEVAIVWDTPLYTFVPEELFSKDHLQNYLEQVGTVSKDETPISKKIKNRPFFLVYPLPDQLAEFCGTFQSVCRILHTSEALLSVADQIDAADHQRGFMLVETQSGSLDILVIQNDIPVISNRFILKNEEEMIYHILNVMKQLNIDRRVFPLYISGKMDENHPVVIHLKKYIAKVYPLPYFIREISKEAISGNILLSEANRCE